VRTIRDIDESGCDLRLWCYACQHTAVIDGIIWMDFEDKGWALDVASARRRFRCKRCGSKDVLLVAAKGRRRSWKAQVEAFFHGRRSAGRRRR